MSRKRTKQPAERWSAPPRVVEFEPYAQNLGTSAPVFTLLLELVRCLDPVEVEEAVLRILQRKLPQRTVLVSLEGGKAEPHRCRKPGESSQPWPPGAPLPPLLAVPVQDQGKVLGWIAVADEDYLDGPEAERVRAALRDVAAAAGVPVRNAQLHAAALSLALHDPLTDLYNRRALEAFLDKQSRATHRRGGPLTLILMDLDRFKEVNDSHGHPVGDLLLQAVAQALVSTVRGSDVVARLGGDEFAVLLPDTDLDSGVRLARRLRHRLDDAHLEVRDSRRTITPRASFGVADFESAGHDGKRMIDLADRALYVAKREGGHRVRRCRAPRKRPPQPPDAPGLAR